MTAYRPCRAGVALSHWPYPLWGETNVGASTFAAVFAVLTVACSFAWLGSSAAPQTQMHRGEDARRVVVHAGCDEQSAESSSDATTPAEALCVYGGDRGAIWLVQSESVAKDLALTPAQLEQIAQLAAELRAESRRITRSLLGGQGPLHEQRVEEKKRSAAAITESFHRQVVACLDPPQRTRLDQIYVQALGPAAFFAPRVAARLALTDAQQQAIRQAVRSSAAPPPFEDLLKLLTAPQREQLAAMRGRPFAFPQRRVMSMQGSSDGGQR